MTLKKITPEEFYKKMKNEDKLVLLDVRAEEKYNDFHIEDNNIDNLNIPKTNILDLDKEKVQSLPKEKEIFVTCTTGNSATKCANILSEKNYNVVVLEGGITAWKEFLQNK